MRITQFISEHSVAFGFGASGGTAVTGATIASINPYLQAIAFVISIAVGVFTIADYIRKHQARKRHDKQSKD